MKRGGNKRRLGRDAHGTMTSQQIISRDELINEVQRGLISPEQAEAEVLLRGLPSLASKPDPARFDPMTTTAWSAAMVIAWIAFRTAEDVRCWWDAYRAECWDWHFRKWRVGVDGPVHEGHFLEQLQPATIDDLRNAEIWQINQEQRQPVMRVADAIHELWSALQAGRVEAFVKIGGTRRRVTAHAWKTGGETYDVRAIDFNARLVEVGDGDPSRVLFDQAVICHRWPVKPMLELSEVRPPLGAGHMTVFHAALWIATKGGTVTFDPGVVEMWRAAYAELLAHIASGDVSVSGVAGGLRETISGIHFADCPVSYPYSDEGVNLIFGQDLFLCSYPYLGEEVWRRGMDDSLQNVNGIRWSRLMVQKDQIAALWPFGAASPRTGTPGRPTSMHLVEAEFERLRAADELPRTLAETARYLANWLKRTHPSHPPATANTIETRIRAAFRKSQKPRN